MNRVWGAAGVAVALMAQGASAQDTGELAVTVDKVRSSDGTVQGILCADKTVTIPTACATYRAQAKAVAGATTLTFTGVKPGDYAVQIYHDENGNGRPDIPPEGYGYGNDAPYPTTFDKAAIKVAGATKAKLNLVYLASAAPASVQGGKGAAAPAGVAKTDVRENGLYAEFYVPPHRKPLPAIILIGGSEGGLDAMSRVGVGFTKQGYAVLALAYWAETGLPQTLEQVPLEYFDQAVAWLKDRPEVDPKAIGAIGGSRGSEAVLLLASRNKDVRAVAAFAPSGVVWQGLNYSDPNNAKPAWTAGGKPLPSLIPVGSAYRPNASMKPMFDLALPDAAKRPEVAIPVERVAGPVLLISGKDDALWPSAVLGEQIVQRLRDKRFRYEVQHLSYDGAGHMVFMGDPSALGASGGGAPGGLVLGGSASANAAAWADNWPKTVAFFDKALKGARR